MEINKQFKNRFKSPVSTKNKLWVNLVLSQGNKKLELWWKNRLNN